MLVLHFDKDLGVSDAASTVVRFYFNPNTYFVNSFSCVPIIFWQGGLALFTTVYLILMSIGAGLAIPGGLFMPSIVVSHVLEYGVSCCPSW